MRLWFASALTFGLLFAALGALVSPGANDIDVRIAAALAPLPLAPIATALNGLGQPLVWDALVTAIALTLLIVRLRRGASLLLLGLGAELPVALAKAWFDRPRPLPPITQLLAGLEEGSYPSGHVVRVGVTAGLLALGVTSPRWRLLSLTVAILLTLAMAIARVSALEHWPTDVIGAGALALAYVSLLMAIDVRLRRVGTGDPRPDPR